MEHIFIWLLVILCVPILVVVTILAVVFIAGIWWSCVVFLWFLVYDEFIKLRYAIKG